MLRGQCGVHEGEDGGLLPEVLEGDGAMLCDLAL
jgi:hypothetical protein